MRLEMESLYWENITFLTLTYNDDNLPLHIVDGHCEYEDEDIENHPELETLYIPTLRRDHLSSFVKRLRKQSALKIRYYGVGEYGTRLGRPHLHLIVFGMPYTVQHVKMVEKCWPYGFVQVKPFFKETCAYVAGYVQKKLYGSDKHRYRRTEFMNCSHHIGEQWMLDHLSEFDDDHPYINLHGYKHGIPRQFRKKLVDMGVLTETSLIVTALLQKKEYAALLSDLENKGTSLSEFFNQRVKNAFAKQQRKLSSRNKTGDI